MARKLEGIFGDLVQLHNQTKIEGFLNNADNAGRLGGLLGDIRNAVMDYQVCMSLDYLEWQRLMFKLEFNPTRYILQKLSTYRKSHPFAPCLC